MTESVSNAPPEEAPRPRATLAVHAVLLLVQVAFASLAVAGKVVMRDVPPFGVAFARLLGGAIVFGAWVAATRGIPRIPRGDVARIAVYAALGVAGNQLFFLSGLARTTAINASVLVATIPVFAVGTAIVLGREPPRLRTGLGVALSLGGAMYLVGAQGFSLGADTVLGDVLVLINCVGYAIYLVLVRDVVARHDPWTVIAIAFAFGAVFAAPLGGADLVHALPRLDARALALLAYVVLVCTVFTYIANAWALTRAKASLVAIYIYVQPIVATVLAVILLGEGFPLRAFLAAVLVFGGIALATWQPARQESSAPTE